MFMLSTLHDIDRLHLDIVSCIAAMIWWHGGTFSKLFGNKKVLKFIT